MKAVLVVDMGCRAGEVVLGVVRVCVQENRKGVNFFGYWEYKAEVKEEGFLDYPGVFGPGL